MSIYREQLREALVRRAKLKRELINLEADINSLNAAYSREEGWKYPRKLKEIEAEIFGHNFGESSERR